MTWKLRILSILVPTIFLALPSISLAATTFIQFYPTTSDGVHFDISSLPEAVHSLSVIYDDVATPVSLNQHVDVSSGTDLRSATVSSLFVGGQYNAAWGFGAYNTSGIGYHYFSTPCSNSGGSQCTASTATGNTYYFVVQGNGDGTWRLLGSTDTSTHIIDFSPENGTTTSSIVTFTLHAYISPDDVGNFFNVNIDYRNIDENSLLSAIPGFSNVPFVTTILFNGVSTTTGDFYFSTTTTLADGDYRVRATLAETFLGITNPFPTQSLNHQFIVNNETFIGRLNQNGFNEYNGILASTTATSTAAAAATCNPLTFNINTCLAFLFVPGGPQLDETMQSFQDGISSRAPWGYFYRVYKILTGTGTSSLPMISTNITVGPPGNTSTSTITFDPGDMIAGGATLINSIHDNQHGIPFRDVMEPFVQLAVALSVIFTIFADVVGSHRHVNHNQPSKKLS